MYQTSSNFINCVSDDVSEKTGRLKILFHFFLKMMMECRELEVAQIYTQLKK